MPKPNIPQDLQSIVMRLLRERLSVYQNNKGEQIIANEVIKQIRNEIMDAVDADRAPEKQKSGAFVMTQEASMQESQSRKGLPIDKNAARPKEV
jgi:hypothetical protein